MLRRKDGAGVEDRREQLDPVHKSWAGPREVRGSVDAEDTRTLDSPEPLRFAGRACRVPAARHRDHDLRPRGDDVVPNDLARSAPSLSEDVLAARDPYLLRYPVAGVEQRVEPFEARDPRPPAIRDSAGRRVQARTELGDDRLRIALDRRRDAAKIVEHAIECRCLERHHARLSREVAWERASGRGTVWTWTIVRGPTLPAFESRLPYNVVDVLLDEGVHFVSEVLDCPPDAIYPAMPVEAVFVRASTDVTLVKFRRRTS